MNEKAPTTALAVQPQEFMPVMELAHAIDRRNAIVTFTQKIMVEKIDYGVIPGVDKPTLLQPGAEKLIAFFGLTPIMELVDKIEDWTGRDHGGEPLFFYRYRCTLKRGDRVLGVEEASANSWEVKYRYRWVPEAQVPAHLDKERLVKRDSSMSEFQFAVTKRETTGQYGKPAEYWQRFEEAINAGTAVKVMKKTKNGEMPAWQIPSIAYRIPNPESTDVINTIMQMAEKRAKIRAVRSCTGASEFYTQDVEDMQPIEGTATVVAEPAAAPAKEGPKPEVKAAAPAGEKAGDEFFEDDGILKLKECDNIGDLTKVFNSMPVDVRRPGTKVFKAFSERREQLTPPGKKKAAQQEAQ